jgi:hypothetical protein
MEEEVSQRTPKSSHKEHQEREEHEEEKKGLSLVI